MCRSVYCSVLQCVVACWSVMTCSDLQHVAECLAECQYVSYSVAVCVAVCVADVLQFVLQVVL